jgi:D-alanine transfer protein
MRRLLAFLTAAVLFFCLVGGYSVYLNQTAIGNANPVNGYLLDRRKFQSPAFIQNNLDDKTMLVFGSSEFSTTAINTHPENLFLKQGYNFNTMLVGQGYYQSLWHAIALGALGSSVKNRKVSIIVSAQWFSKEGITPSAFTGTYSKAMMLDFMKNPSISDKLKDQVENA